MKISITTLTKRADFVRLRRGRKFTCSWFILRYAPSDVPSDAARVGYTVTTKCGNAVIRNRIKRRFRALVAEQFPALAQAGVDYNFIAIDTAKSELAPYDALRAAMVDALTYAAKRP